MTITDFFTRYPKVAIAFSGGVDSAFLLYAGKCAKADVAAYYVKTQFQPQFEYEDAKRLAEELAVPMKVIELDILQDEIIKKNPDNRCYFCKQHIFSAILQAAKADGYELVADGTNASDDAADRPGMKALAELSVRSPLRECGLTKDEIRRLSKEAGLFTWDKPAYACLATRIKSGEPVTEEKLKITEAAEGFLTGLGFSDFRVRMIGNMARLQVKKEQFALALEKKEEIVTELKNYYDVVMLDLEGR
ncbi:MAG: ATP-dependent sacrificial sulfur transferase LarE [Agathobacter sp.]